LGQCRVIIITGSITGRPDTISELVAASLEHVLRSRSEPGCISHSVHRDVENPLRLVFIEQWESPAAVRAHFAVSASAAFVRAAAALSDSPPSLEMFTATPAGELGAGDIPAG
jgi:quinol monooxygenase YgiN